MACVYEVLSFDDRPPHQESESTWVDAASKAREELHTKLQKKHYDCGAVLIKVHAQASSARLKKSPSRNVAGYLHLSKKITGRCRAAINMVCYRNCIQIDEVVMSAIPAPTPIPLPIRRRRGRPFYADWGFWGVVCGILTLIVTVWLAIYIHRDQAEETLAEFRTTTKLSAEGKTLGDAVKMLSSMLDVERREGRRAVIAALLNDFESDRKYAEDEAKTTEAARKANEGMQKAKALADEQAIREAAEVLRVAEAAQAAAAALAKANQERLERQEQAFQRIEARRQERWLK